MIQTDAVKNVKNRIILFFTMMSGENLMLLQPQLQLQHPHQVPITPTVYPKESTLSLVPPWSKSRTAKASRSSLELFSIMLPTSLSSQRNLPRNFNYPSSPTTLQSMVLVAVPLQSLDIPVSFSWAQYKTMSRDGIFQ
jgi:hypothetical protein